MELTFDTVLFDFTYASILIFIAKQLREHVKLFQNYFIPVSLIAGFLGWIVGPNAPVMAMRIVPMSAFCSDYAGTLITLVFATIGLQGLGIQKGKAREKVKDIAGYAVYRQIGWAVQFSLPMIVSILLLSRLHPGLHPGFGWLVPTSFLGGTGVAVAAGEVFKSLGWEDFTGLGVTMSAMGILLGLIGGIIMINIGTKRGYTSYILDTKSISPDMKTGKIPKDKREAIGEETISPITLDALAWHAALILIPSGLGHLLSDWTATVITFEGTAVGLPAFSLGFLLALLFYFILRKTKVYDSVDSKVINKIGNCCSDYLVVFSLVMIRGDVVISYAAPFFLLFAVCGVYAVWFFWRIAPKLIGKDWLERGIFNYGYATGVFATGFCLLRVADPKSQSTALSDTAILTPYEHLIEMFALTVGPIWLTVNATYRWGLLIGTVVYGVIWVLMIPIFKLWRKGRYFVSASNPKYDRSLDPNAEPETIKS